MKNQENVKLKALDSIEGGGAGGRSPLLPGWTTEYVQA